MIVAVLLLTVVGLVLDGLWNDGAGVKRLVKRLFKRK